MPLPSLTASSAKPKPKAKPAFKPVNDVEAALAKRKRLCQHFTPLELVDELVERLEAFDECRILEPSAGDGRIIHALRQHVAGHKFTIEACEIDRSLHDTIKRSGATDIVGTDFLNYVPKLHYDRIIMNPPFDGETVDRHIEHAWPMLYPGGKLIAVGPVMLGNRLDRMKLQFPVDGFDPPCEDIHWEKIGGGKFKAYGTNIEVIIVEINRPELNSLARKVEGCINLATFNAAMLILNDCNIYEEARKLFVGESSAKVFEEEMRRHVNKGGAGYGVKWSEVYQECKERFDPDA